MALTDLQRRVCRILARNRMDAGESYVAGGVALNEALKALRVSRDIDIFHDTEEALVRSVAEDRAILEREGLGVHVTRELRSYVEARVESPSDAVMVQWTRDSAFRFFPLVEHPDLGLTLHPLDLATNKTLALVGRLEVRDWIDLLGACERIQPLGYLAWAACGKDPGFSPTSILEHAARSGRYSRAEVESLDFAGGVPDAGVLASQWHAALQEGRTLVRALPPDEVGKCVLSRDGELFREGPESLGDALTRGGLLFHAGRIRGAWPEVRP